MAELPIVMKQLNNQGQYDTLYPQTTPEQAGAVPVTRTINGMPLTEDITIDLSELDGYTKEETLTAATAQMYGLSASAVPDDVFEFLGKFNLYWWKRRTTSAGWFIKTGSPSKKVICSAQNDGTTLRNIFYSTDGVNLSESGTVSLKSETNLTFTYSQYRSVNSLKGKYFYSDNDVGNYGNYDDLVTLGNKEIYYVQPNAPDATARYSGGSIVEMEVCAVTSEYKIDIGDWEYIQSSDRDAYPDSGESGGYEYQFLGIPFDNIGEVPKITTGSYAGTGTYGKSNANSLTIGPNAKFVIIGGGIVSSSERLSFSRFAMFQPWSLPTDFPTYRPENTSGYVYGYAACVDYDIYSLNSRNKAMYSNGVLSWFNADASSYQLNESGEIYNYVIFS